MENSSDYFDSWMKFQQQAVTALRDQVQQMQSSYQNTGAASDNPFASWSKALFQAFPVSEDGKLGKNTFNKTLFGTTAMQKLFEIWQPLLNAMREKSMDPVSYMNIVDPSQIKQLFDKLFNFDLDTITQLQKSAAEYADLYQKFCQHWAESDQTQSSHFMHGHFKHSGLPEALIMQMQAASGLFEKVTGKLNNVPAIGKEREKIELISKCAKAISTFSSKYIEYQQLMQITGHEAMQSVAKAISEKIQSGEKFEKFDDFFTLWIDINEKAFNKLFHSKEFSQKRNEMTEAGFQSRKLYNEILEDQLAAFPLARRSEMDEVYKIIYDLRKKVKDLESQIQDLKSHH